MEKDLISILIIYRKIGYIFFQKMSNSANMRNEEKRESAFEEKKRSSISQITDELKNKGYIGRKELTIIQNKTYKILQKQPNMLNLQSPFTIVGDIHGQFFDLLNIFQKFGTPATNKYLFLGDYVDRGMFCIEVITLLLAYKKEYPENIFLLRGNHESRILTSNFNFKEECLKKYDNAMYENFMLLFDQLPICALIDKMHFAVHAGISPQMSNLNDIQKITRNIQIPEKGLLCDLLWSDPSDEISKNWQNNKMRSCSYFYSPIQANRFLIENKIKLIIRGHQVQMKGFKYQELKSMGQLLKKGQKNLTLTVFSAPNYCDSYKNEGAIAIVNKEDIKIQCYKCVEHPMILINYMNVLQWSLPFVANNIGKMFMALIKNRSKKKTKLYPTNEIKQKLQQIKKIEMVNSLLNLKAQKNEEIMLELAKKNSEDENNVLDLENMFATFLLKKASDFSEMRPQIFGPKLFMSRRIQLLPDEDQPSDINCI